MLPARVVGSHLRGDRAERSVRRIRSLAFEPRIDTMDANVVSQLEAAPTFAPRRCQPSRKVDAPSRCGIRRFSRQALLSGKSPGRQFRNLVNGHCYSWCLSGHSAGSTWIVECVIPKRFFNRWLMAGMMDFRSASGVQRTCSVTRGCSAVSDQA
jgi:hypothetical protein